jgi:ribose 5-phosphate isomerase B
VEHDNMNILCIGARIIGAELAKEIVKAYLLGMFSTEERHQRRFGKIQKLEANGKTN